MLRFGDEVSADCDFDGVSNLVDNCPFKAGREEFGGCDVDLDKIVDKDGNKDDQAIANKKKECVSISSSCKCPS